MTVRTNLGRRGGWASAAKLAPLALLASCAWSNPANRPVWNAFEQHLVAEDDGWFYVSLPLTVPVGLGAIVVDTVVAHPIQVLDDAVRDAGELWDTASMNFAEAYYTEMAWLPFRAVLTPVAFVGSWAGRSVFDIPRHEPAPSEAELLAAQQRARQEAERRQRAIREEQVRELVAWLERGARRGTAPGPDEWDERFAEPLQRALAGDAAERRSLHVGMLKAGRTSFGPYDATAALRDEDPVVRFAALELWRPQWAVPPALQATLRDDPVESVRLRARALWR